MPNFDQIISKDEQTKWLNNLDYSPLGIVDSASDDNNLEHIEDVEKLRNLPNYDAVMTLLRLYFKIAIPFPGVTMSDYWMCSCFSEPNLIVRINIRDQVVLSIWDEDTLNIYWTLNESVEGILSDFIMKSGMKSPTPWGKGRLGIEGVGNSDAISLMGNKEFQSIVRQCNLSLMQSGKVNWKKDHNFHLAFAILDFFDNQIHTNYDLDQRLFDEDEQLYSEGQLVQRSITERSRNQKLINDAKENFKQKHGHLHCEVCNFNFIEFYGKTDSDNLIEAHHTIPLSQYDDLNLTAIDNIRMVCPNCHRMLHSNKPLPYTIEELKAIVRLQK
jgi:hypothetical protein